MKQIVLCADDYGQNFTISQGILQLIEKNRLSATSCLVNGKAWESLGPDLKGFQKKVDIGLHFNLTLGKPLSSGLKAYYGLPELILRTHFGQIQKKLIQDELQAQLDRFYQVMGCLPAFIDGHQHIHDLPLVREALLRVYEEQLRPHQIYIRNTVSAFSWKNIRSLQKTDLKSQIISLTGGYALLKALQTFNIPHNHSFSGVYSFKQANQYAKLFPEFLSKIQHRGLILCHPGLPSENTGEDSHAEARVLEWNYFQSDAFLQDLNKANTSLLPFSSIR